MPKWHPGNCRKLELQFNGKVSPVNLMSNKIISLHFESYFFLFCTNKVFIAYSLSFTRPAAGKSKSEEHPEEPGKFITPITSAIKS